MVKPDFAKECHYEVWDSKGADYKCKLDKKWCYGLQNCRHPEKGRGVD